MIQTNLKNYEIVLVNIGGSIKAIADVNERSEYPLITVNGEEWGVDEFTHLVETIKPREEFIEQLATQYNVSQELAYPLVSLLHNLEFSNNPEDIDSIIHTLSKFK